jgi:hypothetical protein
LKTSYFARAARLPQAVSIVTYTPKYFTGRVYPDLAPSTDLLRHWIQNLDRVYFVNRYLEETLSKLDAYKVYADLGEDAILLAYEPAGEFSHRVIVAQWLEQSLGIVVPEYEPVWRKGRDRNALGKLV